MNVPLILSESDARTLRALLTRLDPGVPRKEDPHEVLRHEIDRAEIRPDAEIGADVVGLNSHVEVVNLSAGSEKFSFQLCLPEYADYEEGRISILAPLGTAVIGFRTGQQFTWQLPAGNRILKIERVTRKQGEGLEPWS